MSTKVTPSKSVVEFRGAMSSMAVDTEDKAGTSTLTQSVKNKLSIDLIMSIAPIDKLPSINYPNHNLFGQLVR